MGGAAPSGWHSRPAAAFPPSWPLGPVSLLPRFTLHPSSPPVRGRPALAFSREARLPRITGPSCCLPSAHPGLLFSVTNEFGTLGLKRLTVSKACSAGTLTGVCPAQLVRRVGLRVPRKGASPWGTDDAGRGKEAKPKPPDVGYLAGEPR